MGGPGHAGAPERQVGGPGHAGAPERQVGGPGRAGAPERQVGRVVARALTAVSAAEVQAADDDDALDRRAGRAGGCVSSISEACEVATALVLQARRSGALHAGTASVPPDAVPRLQERAVQDLLCQLRATACSDDTAAMGAALRAASEHRRRLVAAAGGAPLPVVLSEALYDGYAACDERHAAVLAARRALRAAWRDGRPMVLDRAISTAHRLSLVPPTDVTQVSPVADDAKAAAMGSPEVGEQQPAAHAGKRASRSKVSPSLAAEAVRLTKRRPQLLAAQRRLQQTCSDLCATTHGAEATARSAAAGAAGGSCEEQRRKVKVLTAAQAAVARQCLEAVGSYPAVARSHTFKLLQAAVAESGAQEEALMTAATIRQDEASLLAAARAAAATLAVTGTRDDHRRRARQQQLPRHANKTKLAGGAEDGIAVKGEGQRGRSQAAVYAATAANNRVLRAQLRLQATQETVLGGRIRAQAAHRDAVETRTSQLRSATATLAAAQLRASNEGLASASAQRDELVTPPLFQHRDSNLFGIQLLVYLDCLLKVSK